MKIILCKILLCLYLIGCTINTDINYKFAGQVTEMDYDQKTLKLRVENELIHFQLSNYKLDIITLNHLKQHMLSGESLYIESRKINGENNITKISDIDGTIHGQLGK